MKKLISILLLVSFCISSLMAQNSHRENGSFSLDAGIGIGFWGHRGYSVVMPPVKLNAEYSVLTLGSGSFSVGGYFSLGVNNFRSYDMKVTTLLVGPMVSFRYALTDRVDVFGKTVLGYTGVTTSDQVFNSLVKAGGFGFGVYLGGTWYFSPKMGLGAEFGYGGPTNFGVHLTVRI